MKIAHISDIHININATRLGKLILNKKGENEVYLNRLKILQFCIYQAIYEEVNYIILTGDIFDKSKPYPQEYIDLDNILKVVKDRVLMIYGNHDDYGSKGCALQPLLSMGYNVAISSLTYASPTAINLVPWGTLKLENIDADSVLALHAGVKDASHKWVEVEGEDGNVDLADLVALQCKAILLGHHHNQCELAPNIWYAGSPECFNFGEENDTKGMLIWDIQDKKTIVKQISTDHLFPKFITYSPQTFLNKEKDKDALVRIKGEVTEKERLDIITKLKTFKCIDYKLELAIKDKHTKVEKLSGKSDTDILGNYLKSKKIKNIEEIIKLDKEL